MIEAVEAPSVETWFEEPMVTLAGWTGNSAGRMLRDLLKANPAAEPRDLDLRTSWEEVRRTWLGWAVGSGERFRLALLAGGEGVLIERLGATDGPLTWSEIVRVHPVVLSLSRLIVVKETGKRIYLSKEDWRGDGPLFGVSEEDEGETVPLVGPDNPKWPALNAALRARIAAEIEEGIEAWGLRLQEAHRARRSGGTGWPAAFCQASLPGEERMREMKALLQDLGAQAYQRFGPFDRLALTPSLSDPGQRPGQTGRTWLSIDLRGEGDDKAARAFLEAEFEAASDRLWPDGWHTLRAPVTVFDPNLGLQLKKAGVVITAAPSGTTGMEQGGGASAALGSFTGRRAPELAEVEIALNAHRLEAIWSEIGPICVKRRYGDYGVALVRAGEVMPVRVYSRGLAPDPLSAISDDAPGVEQFTSWRDAAAAGWTLD